MKAEEYHQSDLQMEVEAVLADIDDRSAGMSPEEYGVYLREIIEHVSYWLDLHRIKHAQT